MLILSVQRPHFVESPVLQRKIIWKPPPSPATACVYMRGMPKPARFTPKENSRKRRGFLLFLQGMEVKFHCWFWEEFMLKLASGRKQRNHNSGLKWGHLGFYCISAPSVPLFTRQWGPAATGVEAHCFFCIWVQLAGKMAFFSEFFLPFCPVSADQRWVSVFITHVLCWPPTALRGGVAECQDALTGRELWGSQNVRLSWWRWDRWHLCEILPFAPLLMHYHALLLLFSSMEKPMLYLPFLSSLFKWAE